MWQMTAFSQWACSPHQSSGDLIVMVHLVCSFTAWWVDQHSRGVVILEWPAIGISGWAMYKNILCCDSITTWWIEVVLSGGSAPHVRVTRLSGYQLICVVSGFLLFSSVVCKPSVSHTCWLPSVSAVDMNVQSLRDGLSQVSCSGWKCLYRASRNFARKKYFKIWSMGPVPIYHFLLYHIFSTPWCLRPTWVLRITGAPDHGRSRDSCGCLIQLVSSARLVHETLTTKEPAWITDRLLNQD